MEGQRGGEGRGERLIPDGKLSLLRDHGGELSEYVTELVNGRLHALKGLCSALHVLVSHWHHLLLHQWLCG